MAANKKEVLNPVELVKLLDSEENELFWGIKERIPAAAGKAFTFTLDVTTKWITFWWSDRDFFPRWKVNNRRTENPSLKTHKLKPYVTYERQDVCFKDERTKRPTGSFISADYKSGYRLTVHVSEYFSRSIYTALYSNAFAFRDKLLNSHRELLYEIGKYGSFSLIETYRLTSTKLSFFVDFTGVWKSEPCSYGKDQYEDNIGNRFFTYDMANLSSIGECYGMALALVEVYMPEWIKHGYKLNVEFYEARKAKNCIGVSYWVTPEEPVLKAW